MDHLSQHLIDNNWSAVKHAITHGEIVWDDLVDQVNGLIHYLAYHNQIKIINQMDPELLITLIPQKNAEGNTICHIAALLNNIDLLNIVISYQPNVIYQKNKLGNTPLYYLVKNHQFIKELVSSIDIADNFICDEYTLLEYYILNKDMAMFLDIYDKITLSNQSECILFTIIQSDNSSHDKLKMMKYMVAVGANIQTLNKEFQSLLIIAILEGEEPIIKYLIKYGIDVNYSGPENNSNPLVLAILSANITLIKMLLAANASVSIPNKYLETPCHLLFSSEICSKIPLALKRIILGKIDDVNRTDHRMNSILNLIIQNDDWRNYEDILEEHKLKIYLSNKDGHYPCHNIDDIAFYHLVYKSYLNQLDSAIEWARDMDNTIAIILDNGDDIRPYRKYIMEQIMSGFSYPEIKHKTHPVKLITTKATNMTHFSAYTYNYICFMCYILQKYPHIKIPGLIPDQIRDGTLKTLYEDNIQNYLEDSPENELFRSIIKDYINHSPILVNHIIIWKDQYTHFFSPYIIKGVKKTLQKYPDTEFILFKLTIVSVEGVNHANIIIYDVVNRIVERFDPYGNVPFIDSNLIDPVLEGFFTKYLPNITYLSPSQVSNGISFQVFSDETNEVNYVENDPNGFCMAWCIWYVEMRIKNRFIPPDVLIRKTIQKINESENKFKDYIRNYSDYIDQEKNIILEKAGIPQKLWYVHALPIPIYKLYLKYIRKIYDSLS